MAAGATPSTIRKKPDAFKKLKVDTGGGAAAAVDFVGSTPSFNFANGAIRRGGEIIVVGLFGGKMATADPDVPRPPLLHRRLLHRPARRNARDDGAGPRRQDRRRSRSKPARSTRPTRRSTSCAKARSSAAWC